MFEDKVQQILSFETLIFDMDGTLLDSEPRHADAWNEIGRLYGIKEVTYEYLAQVGGISTYNIARMLIEESGSSADPLKLAEEKIACYRNKHMHRAECFPFMVDLLKKAAANGAAIAVATGSMLPETQALLDKFGITPYLKAIVSTEQVAKGKPNPDIYLEAARRIGAIPEKTLVFEDTPIGFKGVKAAGMNLLKVKGGKLLTDVIPNSKIVLEA